MYTKCDTYIKIIHKHFVETFSARFVTCHILFIHGALFVLYLYPKSIDDISLTWK